MQYDPTINHQSWQLGYRGKVAVFIDGNNLFHAARFHTIDIDYNKLLRVLLGDGRLLRAFFYTGVDAGAERQQGFLLWMRRNGFRVIHKDLKTFYDGTRKANLDVEIAVDMLSLAGRYDTAVLVSGDEDFVYAVNAVAYKGCRVEVAGFRSNTAPKLIDVADYFIDLGDIAERIRKEITHGTRLEDRYLHEESHAGSFMLHETALHETTLHEAALHEAALHESTLSEGIHSVDYNHCAGENFDVKTTTTTMTTRIIVEANIGSVDSNEEKFAVGPQNFIRITDDE